MLELVSEEYENKTIASRLSLSEHTVKIHIHNIITKFGAQNRTEAAAYWQMQNTRQLLNCLVARTYFG